jgi:hypothetical protein
MKTQTKHRTGAAPLKRASSTARSQDAGFKPASAPVLHIEPWRLPKLRKEADAFNARWEKDGGRLTTYSCPSCKASIKTICPRESDVTPGKGQWDSLKTCTNCGAVNMVVVYPTGLTRVV